MKTTAIGIAIIATIAPAYNDSNVCYESCKVTKTGKALIRNFEGFSPLVYKDSGGQKTIGFGHLLKAGENFKMITTDQAEKILEADLEPVEHAINLSAKR